MKYNLFVSKHAIDQYRLRVHEDELRYERSDKEIEKIIEQAFLHSHHEKNLKENTYLLVYFKDPFTEKIFHPLYYLVISYREEEIFDFSIKERDLVAITIKYPKYILNNLKKSNHSKRRPFFSEFQRI